MKKKRHLFTASSAGCEVRCPIFEPDYYCQVTKNVENSKGSKELKVLSLPAESSHWKDKQQKILTLQISMRTSPVRGSRFSKGCKARLRTSWMEVLSSPAPNLKSLFQHGPTEPLKISQSHQSHLVNSFPYYGSNMLSLCYHYGII